MTSHETTAADSQMKEVYLTGFAVKSSEWPTSAAETHSVVAEHSAHITDLSRAAFASRLILHDTVV